jgi:hypothetical protein
VAQAVQVQMARQAVAAAVGVARVAQVDFLIMEQVEVAAEVAAVVAKVVVAVPAVVVPLVSSYTIMEQVAMYKTASLGRLHQAQVVRVVLPQQVAMEAQQVAPAVPVAYAAITMVRAEQVAMEAQEEQEERAPQALQQGYI